ncbi:MAG: hypothetical protein K6G56_02650 [Clostridiales bacterium]|nr:hypothetical protein [Clostridiales bacterium]
MKRITALLLIAAFTIAFCACNKPVEPPEPSPEPSEASPSEQVSTPEPTETLLITEAPTPEPTALPTPGDPNYPNSARIMLPESFTTEIDVASDTDERYFYRYGDYIFWCCGSESECVQIRKGKELEYCGSILQGQDSYYFEGKTENGFYVVRGSFFDGDSDLPLDSLLFYNVETGETSKVGEALYSCEQCGNYIVGARYLGPEDDDEDVRWVMWIYRHEMKTEERIELYRFDIHNDDKVDRLYIKYFGGDCVYYTMLRGGSSTRFGIFRLNIETGECEKVADHGLPYAVDENGILYYGDFVYVG